MAYNYTGHEDGLPNPKNFTRGNPIPLDSWSLFMSKSDAETYARTNGVAYPGQVVSVIENNTTKVYVIVQGTVTGGQEDVSTRKLQQLFGPNIDGIGSVNEIDEDDYDVDSVVVEFNKLVRALKGTSN